MDDDFKTFPGEYLQCLIMVRAFFLIYSTNTSHFSLVLLWLSWHHSSEFLPFGQHPFSILRRPKVDSLFQKCWAKRIYHFSQYTAYNPVNTAEVSLHSAGLFLSSQDLHLQRAPSQSISPQPEWGLSCLSWVQDYFCPSWIEFYFVEILWMVLQSSSSLATPSHCGLLYSMANVSRRLLIKMLSRTNTHDNSWQASLVAIWRRMNY